MATQTPNYGLSKPAGTDPVDISALNDNADIIDTALNDLDESKQDTLTFDTAPTSGSENPVTSGGVYTALGAKANNSLFNSTVLSGNTDCNDCVFTSSNAANTYNVKKWLALSTSTISALDNKPSDIPSDTQLIQIIYELIRGAGQGYQTMIAMSPTVGAVAYRRYKSSSGFTAWEKIATSEELDTKVDKETGKGLSTNDYTAEDKAAVDDWKSGYIYRTASQSKEITLDPSSAYFVIITYGSGANFYFLNSTASAAYNKTLIEQIEGVTKTIDGLTVTFASSNNFTLFARKLN